jgi:hypothetical protein
LIRVLLCDQASRRSCNAALYSSRCDSRQVSNAACWRAVGRSGNTYARLTRPPRPNAGRPGGAMSTPKCNRPRAIYGRDHNTLANPPRCGNSYRKTCAVRLLSDAHRCADNTCIDALIGPARTNRCMRPGMTPWTTICQPWSEPICSNSSPGRPLCGRRESGVDCSGTTPHAGHEHMPRGVRRNRRPDIPQTYGTGPTTNDHMLSQGPTPDVGITLR